MEEIHKISYLTEVLWEHLCQQDWGEGNGRAYDCLAMNGKQMSLRNIVFKMFDCSKYVFFEKGVYLALMQ